MNATWATRARSPAGTCHHRARFRCGICCAVCLHDDARATRGSRRFGGPQAVDQPAGCRASPLRTAAGKQLAQWKSPSDLWLRTGLETSRLVDAQLTLADCKSLRAAALASPRSDSLVLRQHAGAAGMPGSNGPAPGSYVSARSRLRGVWSLPRKS
mmetsp:Transcript_11778/g.45961  ORF Transcript_11778/g.45961 Transcript_11778/m.45961 type:complete len:156 (-) Transcript_11778:1575-2042(-)